MAECMIEGCKDDGGPWVPTRFGFVCETHWDDVLAAVRQDERASLVPQPDDVKRAIALYSETFLANRPEQHGRPMGLSSHNYANELAFRAVLEDFVSRRTLSVLRSANDQEKP